ncbi:MAG: AMP-binding protein [Candidatus Lokiarchaeota archaeon]|nr:AMP-binding protein [Candidatus Lokiarchaeota archaeon]
MTEYFNKKMETISRKDLKKHQFKLLKKVLARAVTNKYYNKKLKEHNVNIDDIKSLDDITKLPFLTKDDFKNTYPYGLLTVPKSELIRLHATSGTTGNPTPAYYTRSDLETWTNLTARNLYAIGMRKDDVFQNTVTHGLFTGGMGYLQGAQRVGALVIPFGGGFTRRQIKFMQDFGVTTFHAIPSFALKMIETMNELGVDPEKDLDLRLAMLGAELWTESMRDKIEEGLSVEGFDNYGLTEAVGPGVSCECQEKDGLHIWEDCFYVELIDPETGENLEPGEQGELVLTALYRESLPVIRYRTRDLTVLIDDECNCGRTSMRHTRIKSRIDDMMKIRGVNIYPSQIEQIVLGQEEVGFNYIIKVWKKGVLDEISVEAEVENKYFTHCQSEEETFNEMQRIKKELKTKLHDVTLIRINVDLKPEGSIPRPQGKAKRVFDER